MQTLRNGSRKTPVTTPATWSSTRATSFAPPTGRAKSLATIRAGRCTTSSMTKTSHSATQAAKIIGYLPTWRKDLDYNNAVMYQNITHGIIAFLQFDEKNLGELDDK